MTKSTTKNLKENIQEDANEHILSEEDEKVNEANKSTFSKFKIIQKDDKFGAISQGWWESEEKFKKDEQPEESDEIQEFIDEKDPKFFEKVWNYMKNSSLFLFNKDSIHREYLLSLVTTPEDIIQEYKVEANPEKYGVADLAKSQNLKSIKINSGKIITTKKVKLISRLFEYFIILIILMSCILLSIDTPLNNPDTLFSSSLRILDIIFSVIFLIEACMKMFAFGFFHNHYQGISPYIFNYWNILDFTVVIMSFIDIYFSYFVSNNNDAENLSSFKALRAFRALRPLRMISRNEGLKIAIQALLASIPAIVNVVIICLLFVLIFAILGVNFFKGAFYSWSLNDEPLTEGISTRNDWELAGGAWKTAKNNFDNVLIASVTLFSVMTSEGWVDVMSNGVDAVGIDKQPIYKNHPFFVLYFVIFVIFGMFLLINLFTAVITDQFSKIK